MVSLDVDVDVDAGMGHPDLNTLPDNLDPRRVNPTFGFSIRLTW